jgi:hypothetical protein
MEYLVPLMPLLGSLPIAVAAVIIFRMLFRHRELRGSLAQRVGELESELDALRQGQLEMQERLEFSERLLAQLRERPAVARGDS